MSYVTNVILSMGMEGEKLEQVNKFFDGNQKGFVSCDDESLPRGWYGGSKMLEIDIAVGAFNYLSIDELVEHLKTIEWQEPEEIQLLICDKDDNRFSIVQITPHTIEQRIRR